MLLDSGYKPPHRISNHKAWLLLNQPYLTFIKVRFYLTLLFRYLTDDELLLLTE